jgi:hypothetical protein
MATLDRRHAVKRHSYVAIALASGLTLPDTSELARHTDVRITAQALASLTDDGRAQLAAKCRRRLRALSRAILSRGAGSAYAR